MPQIVAPLTPHHTCVLPTLCTCLRARLTHTHTQNEGLMLYTHITAQHYTTLMDHKDAQHSHISHITMLHSHHNATLTILHSHHNTTLTSQYYTHITILHSHHNTTLTSQYYTHGSQGCTTLTHLTHHNATLTRNDLTPLTHIIT